MYQPGCAALEQVGSNQVRADAMEHAGLLVEQGTAGGNGSL
jgi:hypothetical protein